jgi:hypothetical protein
MLIQIIMSNENTSLMVAAPPIPLATRKKNIEADLLAKELELQGLCLKVKDSDLTAIITSYKSKFKSLYESRLEFTNYVADLLIAPFIEIEKRSSPDQYEPFKELQRRELNLRIKTAESGNSAISEKAAFKEHILNEFNRVVKERKIKMLYEIQRCIELKIPVTSPELKETLQDIANEKKVYNKFENKVITNEDKVVIIKTIPQPNYDIVVADMLAEAERLEKVAESEGSLDRLKGAITARVKDAEDEHEEEKEQNKITTAHEVVSIKLPAGKIKEARVIKVENTKEWAEAIIAAFYETETAWLMVKVKNWEKLTVGQMAEALAKCPDVQVEGVAYETIKK